MPRWEGSNCFFVANVLHKEKEKKNTINIGGISVLTDSHRSCKEKSITGITVNDIQNLQRRVNSTDTKLVMERLTSTVSPYQDLTVLLLNKNCSTKESSPKSILRFVLIK
jgi:hypothetical protein